MQVTLKAAENWNLSLKPVLCPLWVADTASSIMNDAHKVWQTRHNQHGWRCLMSQLSTRETSTSGTNSLWSPCHALTKCVRKKNAKDPKIFKTNSIRSTVENPWKSASRWEHHNRGSCARQIVRENELNNLFLLRQLVWVNLSTVHCELQNNRAESGMYWYDHAKYVLFICRYKIINNNS